MSFGHSWNLFVVAKNKIFYWVLYLYVPLSFIVNSLPVLICWFEVPAIVNSSSRSSIREPRLAVKAAVRWRSESWAHGELDEPHAALWWMMSREALPLNGHVFLTTNIQQMMRSFQMTLFHHNKSCGETKSKENGKKIYIYIKKNHSDLNFFLGVKETTLHSQPLLSCFHPIVRGLRYKRDFFFLFQAQVSVWSAAKWCFLRVCVTLVESFTSWNNKWDLRDCPSAIHHPWDF